MKINYKHNKRKLLRDEGETKKKRKKYELEFIK